MKQKKCINCGKTEDQCECGFFEAEGGDEAEELEGMKIEGEDGEDLTEVDSSEEAEDESY